MGREGDEAVEEEAEPPAAAAASTAAGGRRGHSGAHGAGHVRPRPPAHTTRPITLVTSCLSKELTPWGDFSECAPV